MNPERLEQIVAELGEFYDCVQVLVSTTAEGGGTICYKRGCGNWYARIGMARELLNEDSAAEQGRQIAANLEPPE